MTDFVISEDWLQRMDNSPMLSVMQIRDLFAEARSRPLSDELKKERERVLGELSIFHSDNWCEIGLEERTAWYKKIESLRSEPLKDITVGNSGGNR